MTPETELVVDGTTLEQALIKLVVHALQATPKRRSVLVRAHVSTTGETLHLEVADEGSGIDGATRGRIFEPFFSAKATETAASRTSGGAVFTVSVPLSRGEEAFDLGPHGRTG